jgi:hypothetical protein
MACWTTPTKWAKTPTRAGAIIISWKRSSANCFRPEDGGDEWDEILYAPLWRARYGVNKLNVGLAMLRSQTTSDA